MSIHNITVGNLAAAGGGGGDYDHGDPLTLTGSYGSRTVDIDIFDDCSNASISTLWNDADNMAYISSQRSMALPHTNISKYCAGNPSTASGGNAWLAHAVPITSGSKLFCMAYRRVDDAWGFGTSCDGEPVPDEDNNFKELTVSDGGGWFELDYWYHDHTNQKCTLATSWNDSFYSSGNLGNLDDSYLSSPGGSGAQDKDMFYSWVKTEYRMGLGSSGQAVKLFRNNDQDVNLTSKNTFDGTLSGFSVAIGVYARQRDTDQWIYLADVVMVVGTDAYKRVMLTDNATYASSTIVEFQPISSWSGNIGININKGKLSAGTVHLHTFDDADNSSYYGSITLN